MSDEKSCRYLTAKGVYVPAIHSSIAVPDCKLKFNNKVSESCHCGRFKPRPEVDDDG